MKNNPSILIEIVKTYISRSQPKPILTDQDIELCTQFGLGPILADMYLQDNVLIEQNIKEKLSSIKITAQYYSTLYDSAIREIITLLSRLKINLVLLKGIHTSRIYYEHSHQRLMGDIDFLVQKNHTDKITQTLFTLDYKQEGHLSDEFFLTHQHLKPFHHPKKDTWVEVHTCLFSKKSPQGKRKLFQPQYIFENLTPLAPLEPCTDNVYGLNAELNLHYTITHWVREFRIVNSLIQLVDIIKIIETNQIDWSKFAANIETLSHATEVKIIINLLVKNDLIQLPEKNQRDIFNQKDSAGIIGKWLMHSIINGYLYQNKFITRIIGHTNCSRIWDAYLRDTPSIANHFYALSAISFAEIPGSKSKLHSLMTRLKRLYLRYITGN